MSQPEPLRAPRRVLAVGAHPDDIEFGAGGTLAAWARAGATIVMAVMTDGSKGTWDPDVDPAELVRQRADEQRVAAGTLGADEVELLGYVDGELENTAEVRSRVTALIRAHRPDVLLTHDPWARYELHPDHRATGWAVVDGAVAARDHLFYPEQELAHHRPDWLLLWKPADPNHWEDIADTIATKAAALLCHGSQHETTMDRAGDGGRRRTAFIERLRADAASQGAACGMAAAEAFRKLRL